MLIRRFKNRIYPKKYKVRDLPQYVDRDEKAAYFDMVVITTTEELEQYITPLFLGNTGKLVFRGINNASFKMFSTVQRQWYWNGFDAYFSDIPSYINYQIKRVRNDVFLKNHLCSDNDYNILAMIQHFWGNSNLIDFSYSLKSALFFAWDGYFKNFPQNGSLNDYVSLYVLDSSIPILAGPQIVNLQGASRLDEFLMESDYDAKQIDATDALNNLVKMPYEAVYDGKVVHGGHNSNVKISVPFFKFTGTSQITNINLAAQNGCFLQGSSNESSLEEVLLQQNRYYNKGIIMKCFDIHKRLMDNLCRRYDVPMNRDEIYPDINANEDIYKHVKALDKYVPWLWLRNKCMKLK